MFSRLSGEWRVIDNHAIRRSGIEQFDSARNGAHVFKASANRVRRNARANRNARRQQRIVYVEYARELQRNRLAESLMPRHQKRASALRDLDIVGVNVAAFANAHAQRLAPERLDAARDVFVINIVNDILDHFGRK